MTERIRGERRMTQAKAAVTWTMLSVLMCTMRLSVAFKPPTCGILQRCSSNVQQHHGHLSGKLGSSVLFPRPGHREAGRQHLFASRTLPRLRMVVETAERVQKILPLYDGRNLIIGDRGWYLESTSGADELYGDVAVPLEMNDEERGEFTEWILYREGEVVTTVTEDQIDISDTLLGASSSTLSNPIGAELRTGAGGFVLGTLASVLSALAPVLGGSGNGPSISGDSGTAFRLFGSIFGLSGFRAKEDDDTWALWDVNRERSASKNLTPKSAETPAGAPPRGTGTTGVPVPPAAQQEQLASTESVKDDAQWIAVRREGMIMLREASVTLQEGDFDEAVNTCQQAIALFQSEVMRGVGAAAEEMLARAISEATNAKEAELQQAEARAEATRLAGEAESWLKNGDLDMALIMADRAQALTYLVAERAQESLNELARFYGRITTSELTQVLEIKVRVQEKLLMRKLASTTVMRRDAIGGGGGGGGDGGGGSSSSGSGTDTVSDRRAAMEGRQRQKLVEKKKEDARRKRAGEVTSNSSAALARKDSKIGVVEEWREDKALGASLDRAARQALKEGNVDQAAALAQRAVESFKAAARKGFLRGESEAKGSQNILERAMALASVQQARAVADGRGAGPTAVAAADSMGVAAWEAENAELEALFSVEAFSTMSGEEGRGEEGREGGDKVTSNESKVTRNESSEPKRDAAARAEEGRRRVAAADEAQARQDAERERARGTQFTCFTSTKVQILTPELRIAAAEAQAREEAESSRAMERERARESERERERERERAREREEAARKEAAAEEARAAAEAQLARAAEEVRARATAKEQERARFEAEERARVEAEAAAAKAQTAAELKEAEERGRAELNEAEGRTKAEERARAGAAADEEELTKEEEARLAAAALARMRARKAAKEEEAAKARVRMEEEAAAAKAREDGEARRTQDAARDAEMALARERASSLRPPRQRVDPPPAPTKPAGEGSEAGAREAEAGKMLRSLGGTQIVDFSQVNRAGFDPTVKEIVSQKFFGSDGARMKEPIGVKRYEMEVKYHGILLGKKGITVKALEKASGATIRFETTPTGALVIMGTGKQRDVAWKLITSVQATLPKILSQIRENEIRPGEMKTLPDFQGRVSNQEQVWPVAVNEAITRAKDTLDNMRDNAR